MSGSPGGTSSGMGGGMGGGLGGGMGGISVGVSDHYRAVCRALVAEALELASFLKKVEQGSRLSGHGADLLSSELEIQALHRDDWVSAKGHGHWE